MASPVWSAIFLAQVVPRKPKRASDVLITSPFYNIPLLFGMNTVK